MLVYWNNDFINVDDKTNFQFFDRAFHFGDGVYETIGVKNKKPVFFKEHMDRLFYDAEKINIPVKKDIKEWETNVDKIINSNNFNDGFLKIIITRGTMQYAGLSYPDPQNPSVFIWGQECNFTPLKDKKPYKIAICQNERRNQFSLITYVKTLNYLSNIIAKHEADEKGCDEAILVNTEGNLCEGTTSNIFLIEDDNKISTPEIQSGLLNGIIRSKIIEQARQIGITVEERKISPDNLRIIKGCFLTSSLIEIMPVAEICGVVKYNVDDFIGILEKINSNMWNI